MMNLPLEGVRMLDLSRLLPGPLCSQILGDLGAEVLKIEDPFTGDYTRWDNPKVRTLSAHFHMINRNKKSIKLNLKDKRGREIFLELTKKSDILLEAFRPGVMDKLGLGWEDLKTVNSGLIYCSLTGYGQTGPYRDLPGHDINYLSISGILDLIGEKGGPPVIPGIQIADIGAGSINAALNILAAYIAKEKTGKGQHIDVAMIDGLTPFLSLYMADYMVEGHLLTRGEGLLSGYYACYNVYETADNRFMALGCLEQKFWGNFLAAINREELLEEQFVEGDRRIALIQEIKDVFKQKTGKEWIEFLANYDVCCTLVNTLEEAINDPHIKHRGLWSKICYEGEGEIPQGGFPCKFSDMNPGLRTLPPAYGEDTVEVLRSLGISAETMEELARDKVI